MGQYYKAVNITNREYINPHNYNSGAKLMEHSYVGNETVEVAGRLLLEGNSWHKTRLVWAGDYGDEYKFLEEFNDEIKKTREYEKENNDYYKNYKLEDIKVNLYSVATETFASIEPWVNEEYTLENVVRYYFSENKKEYFDISLCRVTSEYGHIVHPLPILISNGNGRGNGDYVIRKNSLDEYFVGRWSGDTIFSDRNFSKIKYKDYTEIIPDFMENGL